jgi:type IV secretory pathway TrbL component
MPLSLATLALHTIVLLVLLGAYRGTVAPDSLVAMTLRITVWVSISALLFIQAGSKGKAVPVDN